MFNSQIITGGREAEQKKALDQLTQKHLGTSWPQPHPDLLVLKPIKDNLTINQIRELKNKLALKPYSAPVKLAVILAADKLTLPAQNALLKTLEEPPAHSLIILVTDQPDLLLPTILSRCTINDLGPREIKKLDPKKSKIYLQSLKKVLSAKAGERLKIASQVASNREQAQEIIQAHLYLFRQSLRQKPAAATVVNLKACQTALRQLDASVNFHLVLGNLFLSYSASAPGSDSY